MGGFNANKGGRMPYLIAMLLVNPFAVVGEIGVASGMAVVYTIFITMGLGCLMPSLWGK